MHEGFAHLLVDLFQGFQAIGGKAGAHDLHMPGALLREGDQAGLGVGLQPLGLAKARLEGDHVLALTQAQRRSQQRGGFPRLALVRIAQAHIALGNAVKAQHQFFGTALLLPALAHRCGQRGNVARVAVVIVYETQLGEGAHATAPGAHGVDHARRGGGRILRVQRQHQHPAHAFSHEGVELARNGRVAIAHGRPHPHVVPGFAQPAAQQLGLFFGPYGQRRAFGHPDGLVLGGRFGGTGTQDHAVQQRFPDYGRNLDHPGVAQKLGQIAAGGGGGGGVGRAQVAQQNAGGVLGFGAWERAGA
ncbi:hypothetical protein D3C72_1406300 [compost metagenome]